MDTTMSYEDRDPYGMYKLPPGSEFASDNSRGPGPELMGANTLQGNDVFNDKAEDLGDIKEIMLNMRSGKISYAVLSFGGFMGVGEKLFAVPWQALILDTENKRFVLNVDKDRLQNAPGFDKDKWPNMADTTCAEGIHAFYGTKAAFDGEDTPQYQTQTLSERRGVPPL